MNCDFHTHILPGLDDGAKNLKQSTEMLQMLYKQGVKTACLTPHFYDGNISVDEFLKKRNKAYSNLKTIYDVTTMPALLAGAEIYLTRSLGTLDLSPLRLEGTDILLIEFPHERFDYWMFDTLEDIMYMSNSHIMIAHVDRVLSIYGEKICSELFSYGDYIFQINADAVTRFIPNFKLMKLLSDDMQIVLGSDTHNTSSRQPDFGIAAERLTKYPYKKLLPSIIDRTEAKYIR